MTKKLLFIWTFLLMFIGGISAEEVTIDFTTKGYGNGKEVSSIEQDGITVKFDKGTNTNNPPKFFTSGNAIRIYGGGFMTVSSSKNITGIEITFGTGDSSNEITTDNGTYNNGKWTGESSEIKFTVGGTSGNRRFQKLVITLEDAENAVKAPTITGESPFIGSTEISLACETEGASIYYTTDGITPPNSESTLYTEPFTIEATTTVQAIAINGENVSTVAKKTFEAIPTVANIESLNALEKNAVFAFIGDAVVVANQKTSKNYQYIYIKDATGSSLIYDASGKTELSVGNHITPNWTGTVDVYNGLFEAKPTSTLTAVEGTAETITYPEVTATDINEDNINKIVTIKGVTYTAPDEKNNFKITAGETEITGYNQFGIEINEPAEGDVYDIVGAISIYNTTIQLQPIAITRAPQVKAVTINAETGTDITTLVNAEKEKVTNGGDIVGDITINLAADGAYTMSGAIEAVASITINGDANAPATINASTIEEPFIMMSTTPSVDIINDYYRVDAVKIANITVKGLKNSIFYDNNTKYCVVDFTIDNSSIELTTESVKNEAFISFQGGGAKNVTVKNSTIYGNASTAKYFIRYNNSARLDRYGFDKNTDFQTMTYLNNTFNKVIKADGQWGNYSGISGQKFTKLDIEKNIWVDCGKDIIRRLAGGNINGSAPVTFVNNTYFMDGEDISTSESNYDKSGTILITNPAFANADNGDFTIGAGTQQAKEQTGDPRWLVEFVAEDLTDAKAELLSEIERATTLLGEADVENNEAAKALKNAIDKAQGVYDTAEFIEMLKAATEELKAAEEAYIATGINNINADTDKANGAWYNMQGVRIEKPAQKGIYIHNGQKVAIK